MSNQTNADFIRERIERAFVELAEREGDPAAALTLFSAQDFMLRCWKAYTEGNPPLFLNQEELDALAAWDREMSK